MASGSSPAPGRARGRNADDHAIGTTLVAAGASGVATVANDGLSGMIGGSAPAEHKAGGLILIGGRPSPLGDVQRFLKINVADFCEMPHRPNRRRWSAAAGVVTAQALPTERKPAGFGEPNRRARQAHKAAAQTVIWS